METIFLIEPAAITTIINTTANFNKALKVDATDKIAVADRAHPAECRQIIRNSPIIRNLAILADGADNNSQICQCHHKTCRL
ncbi:MAG: hypothetical protein FWC93_00175 [Defluviitaleaceae bacterium]|nr:hypothetical protein [Defluviitaleaceae bacterium]